MREKHLSHSRQISHYALRRNLGILGLSLPLILFLGNWILFDTSRVQPSISHYYYTGMTVYFTGVLWAFGMFLYAYKGFKLEDDEYVSDNLATNLAGIFAIGTALFPTEICEQGCGQIQDTMNGHANEIIGFVHFSCAGLFLIIMGWISIFRFTKTKPDKMYKRHKRLTYIIAGYTVWGCILFLLIDMFILPEPLHWTDVFIAETIALIAFGTSWLVKSEAVDPMMASIVGAITSQTQEEVFQKA